MSTYSEVYVFDDLPLLGAGAGFVSGKAFVAIDPVTTDYYIAKLLLDDAVVPSDNLLWDVLVLRLREARDDEIRALAATIDLTEDRDVAPRPPVPCCGISGRAGEGIDDPLRELACRHSDVLVSGYLGRT